MKYALILTLIIQSLVFADNTDNIKYDIEEVFVVPTGYDTNDNIEVTFISKLPNACFSPADSIIAKRADKEFEVNFYIKKKEITNCINTTESEIINPIYFTHTISLGELTEGDYKVFFSSQKDAKFVTFNVSKSITDQTDDEIYAPVTNAFIPDLIYTSNDVQVILTGIIQDSCLQIFNRFIDIKRYGNTFVVIPKAIINPNIDCEKVEKPLQKIVSLGPIQTEGTYFVHVRSQSGLSVNKVFRVKEKGLDPSGR